MVLWLLQPQLEYKHASKAIETNNENNYFLKAEKKNQFEYGIHVCFNLKL